MRSSKAHCSLSAEFSLVNENLLLQAERITQLHVIQSVEDPLLWFGVLFVDSGIYFGAVLRFNMIIDNSYPDCQCPKIVFDPIPYHPLVDPKTGLLDTKNAFPEWDSKTHKLYQLLLFVKRVIIQADIYIKRIQEVVHQNLAGQLNQAEGELSEKQCFDSSLTDMFVDFNHALEFIRIYENNQQEFQHRVDEFRQKCSHQLFERPSLCGDDQNALIFSQWIPEIHEKIKDRILAGRFSAPNLFASYHKETDSVSFIPGSEPN